MPGAGNWRFVAPRGQGSHRAAQPSEGMCSAHICRAEGCCVGLVEPQYWGRERG